MQTYTCHDAAVIFKRKTLLSKIKNFTIKTFVVPMHDLEQRKFIVVIDDNEFCSSMAYKIDCKAEAIMEEDYLKYNDLIKQKKTDFYEVIVKNDFFYEDDFQKQLNNMKG